MIPAMPAAASKWPIFVCLMLILWRYFNRISAKVTSAILTFDFTEPINSLFSDECVAAIVLANASVS